MPGSAFNTLPVGDLTALVKGSADPTKQVRFEVDGLTTGTTRVITVPDANFTLNTLETTQTVSGAKTFTSPVVASVASTATIVTVNGTYHASNPLQVWQADGATVASVNRLGNFSCGGFFTSGNEAYLSSAGMAMRSASVISFSGSANYFTSVDVYLGRGGANTAYVRGDSAAGVSATFQLQGRSSTTSGRATLDIVTAWADSTDATRKARRIDSIYDTAAREVSRDETDGSRGYRMLTVHTTAPSDAMLPNGSIAFYINGTNLGVKYKNGSGTVTTGTVTLS